MLQYYLVEGSGLIIILYEYEILYLKSKGLQQFYAIWLRGHGNLMKFIVYTEKDGKQMLVS